MRVPIIVFLGAVLLTLCSCGSMYTSFEEAGSGGFVPEVDEPSTRGQLQRVTPIDMNIAFRFAISPNGTSIVFSGRPVDSDDPYQLYRIDIGSMTVVKLTSGGYDNAFCPSYTDDGASIVFQSSSSFWKIRADGAGAKIKVPGGGQNTDTNPFASLTGRVLFNTYDFVSDKSLIWAIGTDGTDLTQYREGGWPVWSPDGNTIAFHYEDDIWMMDATGTNLTQLTSTPDIGEYTPTFSPDGQKIAYTSNEDKDGEGGSVYNIWYMNVDGTGKSQVTELDSWDSWPMWGVDGLYFMSGRQKGDSEAQRIWRLKMNE